MAQMVEGICIKFCFTPFSTEIPEIGNDGKVLNVNFKYLSHH